MSRRIQSGHCTDALCLAVRTNAFLKTKMCPKLDSCALGKNCSFAHSDRELRPLPEFKKTAICYNYRRGKCFDRGCKFAHGEEDMMGYIPQTTMQARKICPFFMAGVCRDENCIHAHLLSRRAASRLKTFLIALRNALTSARQAGELPIPMPGLKRKLKGGIPWQSFGFASFKDAIQFLPGTCVTGDDGEVDFAPSAAMKDLIHRLQEIVDSQRGLEDVLPSRFGQSEPSSASGDHAEITTPVRSTFGLPQQLIRPEQVVGSNCDFFLCPVCEGVAIDPWITEKCSHVICRVCMEIWRSLDRERPFNCPRCQVMVEASEVTPVSPDAASPTAAALAVIYDSILVNCQSCPWTGSPREYPVHPCQSAPEITPRSGLVVAMGDYEAAPPGERNVLPVKQGELLELTAESDSGWAFVTKETTRESGWTPASYLSPTRGSSATSSSKAGDVA